MDLRSVADAVGRNEKLTQHTAVLSWSGGGLVAGGKPSGMGR